MRQKMFLPSLVLLGLMFHALKIMAWIAPLGAVIQSCGDIDDGRPSPQSATHELTFVFHMVDDMEFDMPQPEPITSCVVGFECGCGLQESIDPDHVDHLMYWKLFNNSSCTLIIDLPVIAGEL